MALSNSQYDVLIHEYEIKQFENRQRALDRQRELYQHIPELHNLDEQAASLSVQSVISQLESDSNNGDTLHKQLEEIKELAAERNRLAQKLDDSVQDDRGSKNSFAARYARFFSRGRAARSGETRPSSATVTTSASSTETTS